MRIVKELARRNSSGDYFTDIAESEISVSVSEEVVRLMPGEGSAHIVILSRAEAEAIVAAIA